MGQVISSSKVGIKIYEWYRMIRQFSVPDAEILKTEVEQEISELENEQEVLMYYQLMAFRHQLMLDYIEPTHKYGDRPTTFELLEKIETSQKKLSGILQYYSYFFRGMFEFDKKEYVKAIGLYLKAEKQLSFVSDEIEKAEFHYKVGESFYIMKQTHVSMHHILQALKIFDENDQHMIRRIQCLFMIAGNYDDLKYFEKARPHLENALSFSEELNNNHLIGSSLYNLAYSYAREEDFTKAIVYFRRAVELSKSAQLNFLPRALFGFCWALLRVGNIDEGHSVLKEGLSHFQDPQNLYNRLYSLLEALYITPVKKDEIHKIFNYLEEKKLYAFMESSAYDTATHFEKLNDYESSTEFFLKMVYAQKQIQRGECLYDY
ncbi:tetratricopeptide repeat protein [Bacillus gobiensis]|uniref:response regulator aspartate phosphatase n=1 Tax=Bacillus gobiensis TaxID=1441095 RepID=UPI003D25C085